MINLFKKRAQEKQSAVALAAFFAEREFEMIDTQIRQIEEAITETKAESDGGLSIDYSDSEGKIFVYDVATSLKNREAINKLNDKISAAKEKQAKSPTDKRADTIDKYEAELRDRNDHDPLLFSTEEFRSKCPVVIEGGYSEEGSFSEIYHQLFTKIGVFKAYKETLNFLTELAVKRTEENTIALDKKKKAKAKAKPKPKKKVKKKAVKSKK